MYSRTAKMHEYLRSLRRAYEPRAYEPRPLQRFERGNAVELPNGIMFDFYPGLPHIHLQDLKNIKNVKECRDGMPKSMQTR